MLSKLKAIYSILIGRAVIWKADFAEPFDLVDNGKKTYYIANCSVP